MKKKILINKSGCKGLYGKLIIRLLEAKRDYNYIPWSNLYEKLGRNFSIKKLEVRELLFFLKDLGFIEISPKGVKLLFEVKHV